MEVSLYFADLPLSWHSKTCRLSHDPDGADGTSLGVDRAVMLVDFWDVTSLGS